MEDKRKFSVLLRESVDKQRMRKTPVNTLEEVLGLVHLHHLMLLRVIEQFEDNHNALDGSNLLNNIVELAAVCLRCAEDLDLVDVSLEEEKRDKRIEELERALGRLRNELLHKSVKGKPAQHGVVSDWPRILQFDASFIEGIDKVLHKDV